MRKIAIIMTMLIVALFSISCATSDRGGKNAKSSRSELYMPPGWGGQYGGR